MSRLLYKPVIGLIALMIGCWVQLSEDLGDESSSYWSLSPASAVARDCSSQRRSVLTPRMTNGILGGERRARCRARSNASPRL